jgi:hypothetical protein
MRYRHNGTSRISILAFSTIEPYTLGARQQPQFRGAEATTPFGGRRRAASQSARPSPAQGRMVQDAALPLGSPFPIKFDPTHLSCHYRLP